MKETKDIFEGNNQVKEDVVLDTSSVNTLIRDNDLSNKFFSAINKRNSNVVIPYKAFSELSNDIDVLKKFNCFYQKHQSLKISEPGYEKIKREINCLNTSNLYFKREIDIFSIVNECHEENKQHNNKQKKAWKQNCRKISNRYSKDHDVTNEERNKVILRIIESNDLLINYEDSKDYWVLDVLSYLYNIELPKEKIFSDKNRYKHINLLHYLLLFNLWRSPLRGKSFLSPKKGDLFDMEIASFSAYSSCFISEDKSLVYFLNRIKNSVDIIGFENKFTINSVLTEYFL